MRPSEMAGLDRSGWDRGRPRRVVGRGILNMFSNVISYVEEC